MEILSDPTSDMLAMPRFDDGAIDMQELLRRLAEQVVNAVMDAEADQLCGGGANSRNGYRERSLATCVGTLTLRIPKLRSGSFLPEDVIERYQRVDRALVAAVAEMYATGTSTRKVQRVAEKMVVSRLSKDQLSAIASSLDADIEELCGRLLGSSPVPYVWLDATYVKRRREGRVDGPQEGQPRVVYDGARLEAEARRMLRSVLELADRAETAWGINRISGSGTPGRLASVQALRQLSQHYRPL